MDEVLISPSGQRRGIGFLSGNMLKIFAAIAMAFDHAGFLLLGDMAVYRIIGRLAMPIFAFFIAEGCKYTKNKINYFALMFIMGAGGYAGAIIFADMVYGSILVTFSFSIIIIYCMQHLKKCIFSENRNVMDIIIAALLLIFVVWGIWYFNTLNDISYGSVQTDYGFFGIIAPAFVSLFDFHGLKVPKILKILDNHYTKLVCLAVALVLLANSVTFLGDLQWYGLLSLIPLAFYNGKRGKYRLKYFFYIYYPAHLAVIGGIYLLLN